MSVLAIVFAALVFIGVLFTMRDLWSQDPVAGRVGLLAAIMGIAGLLLILFVRHPL